MASKQNVGNGNINLHVGGDEANLRIGGGATVIKNYNFLNNKPQINGVELIGNKTFADLGLAQEPLIVTATQLEQPGAEDTYTLDNATFNDIAYAIYNGRNVFIRTTSDTFPYSNLIYDAESNRWAYVFGGTIASGGMIYNKFFIVLNNPGNIGTLIRNNETFVSTVNGQSGYVTIEDKIHTDTTANWNAQRDFVAENGHVYVYSDYQTIDGVPVPGFKVGDGSSYLIDMPFAGASDRASLEEHINDNVRHITAEEREFWNNKVTCFISSGDNETVVFTKNNT